MEVDSYSRTCRGGRLRYHHVLEAHQSHLGCHVYQMRCYPLKVPQRLLSECEACHKDPAFLEDLDLGDEMIC